MALGNKGNQKITVSVAMATYNGSRYLDEQIQSILDQNYKIAELIICDDNSSDNTCEIIEKYILHHPDLITLVKNEKNLGYIKNFEKCIRLCHSEVIALSDQDDIWERDKIEVLVKSIKNNAIVHSDALLIDSQGKILSRSFSRLYGKRRHVSLLSLLYKGAVTGCTMLFHRDLLLTEKEFPEKIPHDYFLSLIGASKGIIYVNRPLVKYRIHGGNQIGFSIDQKKAEPQKTIFDTFKDIFLLRRRRTQLLNVLEIRLNEILPIIVDYLNEEDIQVINEFQLFLKRGKNPKFIDFRFFCLFIRFSRIFPKSSGLSLFWKLTAWFNPNFL